MTHTPRIRLDRIRQAAEAIDPVFLRTPQYPCGALSEALGAEVVLKVETLNPIRCFKGRGAEFLMAEAGRTGDTRPIVTASAGNFGQAVAYAARRRGRTAVVYAAETANPLKLARMRALGAEVRLAGADFDAAKAEAKRVAAETGARMVEDSLDVETAEGAGTIGLELAGLPRPLDALIVPLGNGAMINGIGAALRGLGVPTEVIAVQAEGAPAMTLSWRAGRAVATERAETIADGIAVRVPVPEAVADMAGAVDDAVTVADALTVEGMRLLLEHAGVVAEPSAGIAVGALLADPARFAGRRVGVVVCGGNVTAADRARWGL